MGFIPSTDQIKGQLQIVLPAVGAVLLAFGANREAGYITTAEIVVGPLAIIVGSVWALVDQTREAIMRKASKPVTPNAPAPQIVLPSQESALADKLPGNVTSLPK